MDLGELRLWPTPELGPEPYRTQLGFVQVDNGVKDAVLGATLVVEVERLHDGQPLVHRVVDVTPVEAAPCVPPDPP